MGKTPELGIKVRVDPTIDRTTLENSIAKATPQGGIPIKGVIDAEEALRSISLYQKTENEYVPILGKITNAKNALETAFENKSVDIEAKLSQNSISSIKSQISELFSEDNLIKEDIVADIKLNVDKPQSTKKPANNSGRFKKPSFEKETIQAEKLLETMAAAQRKAIEAEKAQRDIANQHNIIYQNAVQHYATKAKDSNDVIARTATGLMDANDSLKDLTSQAEQYKLKWKDIVTAIGQATLDLSKLMVPGTEFGGKGRTGKGGKWDQIFSSFEEFTDYLPDLDTETKQKYLGPIQDWAKKIMDSASDEFSAEMMKEATAMLAGLADALSKVDVTALPEGSSVQKKLKERLTSNVEFLNSTFPSMSGNDVFLGAKDSAIQYYLNLLQQVADYYKNVEAASKAASESVALANEAFTIKLHEPLPEEKQSTPNPVVEQTVENVVEGSSPVSLDGKVILEKKDITVPTEAVDILGRVVLEKKDVTPPTEAVDVPGKVILTNDDIKIPDKPIDVKGKMTISMTGTEAGDSQESGSKKKSKNKKSSNLETELVNSLHKKYRTLISLEKERAHLFAPEDEARLTTVNTKIKETNKDINALHTTIKNFNYNLDDHPIIGDDIEDYINTSDRATFEFDAALKELEQRNLQKNRTYETDLQMEESNGLRDSIIKAYQEIISLEKKRGKLYKEDDVDTLNRVNEQLDEQYKLVDRLNKQAAQSAINPYQFTQTNNRIEKLKNEAALSKKNASEDFARGQAAERLRVNELVSKALDDAKSQYVNQVKELYGSLITLQKQFGKLGGVDKTIDSDHIKQKILDIQNALSTAIYDAYDAGVDVDQLKEVIKLKNEYESELDFSNKKRQNAFDEDALKDKTQAIKAATNDYIDALKQYAKNTRTLLVETDQKVIDVLEQDNDRLNSIMDSSGKTLLKYGTDAADAWDRIKIEESNQEVLHSISLSKKIAKETHDIEIESKALTTAITQMLNRKSKAYKAFVSAETPEEKDVAKHVNDSIGKNLNTLLSKAKNKGIINDPKIVDSLKLYGLEIKNIIADITEKNKGEQARLSESVSKSFENTKKQYSSQIKELYRSLISLQKQYGKLGGVDKALDSEHVKQKILDVQNVLNTTISDAYNAGVDVDQLKEVIKLKNEYESELDFSNKKRQDAFDEDALKDKTQAIKAATNDYIDALKQYSKNTRTLLVETDQNVIAALQKDNAKLDSIMKSARATLLKYGADANEAWAKIDTEKSNQDILESISLSKKIQEESDNIEAESKALTSAIAQMLSRKSKAYNDFVTAEIPEKKDVAKYINDSIGKELNSLFTEANNKGLINDPKIVDSLKLYTLEIKNTTAAINEKSKAEQKDATFIKTKAGEYQTYINRLGSITDDEDRLESAKKTFSAISELAEELDMATNTPGANRDTIASNWAEKYKNLIDESDIENIKTYADAIEFLNKVVVEFRNETAKIKGDKTLESAITRAKTEALNQASRIEKYLEKNPRVLKSEYGPILESLIEQLTSNDGWKDIENISHSFADISRNIHNAGLETETLSEKFEKLFGEHLSTALVMGALHQLQQSLQIMYQNVVDIDAAMAELRKVSNMTAQDMANYMEQAADQAARLGVSITSYVSSTAD